MTEDTTNMSLPRLQRTHYERWAEPIQTFFEWMESELTAARNEEREACAQLVLTLASPHGFPYNGMHWIAKAIRERWKV
jgi:hypothetical protein